MDEQERLYLSEASDDEEIIEALEIYHYGTPRHSGRYPWGSGKNPQRSKDIIMRNKELKDMGLSEADRAKQILGKNATTDNLRAELDYAAEARHIAGIYEVRKWADKGYSNMAIAKRTGLSEGTVRNYLKEDALEKAKKITPLIDLLKKEVDEKEYVQVGKGVEAMLNVSEDKKKHALMYLKNKGYTVTNIQVKQAGTAQGKTTIMVLAKPGTTYRDIVDNHIKDIKMPTDMCVAENLKTGEPEIKRIRPPVTIDGKRVFIRYREEGGLERDGTIELRPGVEDLNLGNSHYAQVRISVDDKYYMKGMAFNSDDVPDGYDVVYNTNKPKGTELKDVYKKLKNDLNDPKAVFGALIKPQKDYISADGETKQSALNIVREEGEWSDWTNSLPSQFLAKQSVPLAKQQLDLDLKIKKDNLNEIMQLTNPVVKRKMLADFADECDGAAVHLKAAAMPRQCYHVILPLDDIKENEIYAPNYNPGEKVMLVRFPHGGIFEMPELTVNNSRSKKAKKFLNQGVDCVGINSKVAEQLSGADFDGDTVLVIPNIDNRIQNAPPLEGLKDFDTKAYKFPADTPHKLPFKKKSEGGDGMDDQKEMGIVSNLIMDMTLKKAEPDDLAAAVRYSMVVIDAKKHDLDYKAAKNDNHINDLRRKYRGNARKGADTLITKAKSPLDVEKRSMSYSIDPETGKKIWREAKDTHWTDKEGNEHTRYQKSTKMYEAEDANELLGPNPTEMEKTYAKYANECKALGNMTRRIYLATPKPKRDPDMTKKYEPEVESLKVKLNEARKASVYEKQAQMLADTKFNALLEENPDMSKDEQKKRRGQCIVRARDELGFKKYQVKFTAREWEAVQNNAVSTSMFEELLNKADMDVVRELAMPRKTNTLTSSKKARIEAMLNTGYTQGEIADALGISKSTVNSVLKEKLK